MDIQICILVLFRFYVHHAIHCRRRQRPKRISSVEIKSKTINLNADDETTLLNTTLQRSILIGGEAEPQPPYLVL